MSETERPPMPKRIARLARDRRGYPIPYVALWSSERLEGPPAVYRTLRLPSATWRGHTCTVMDTPGVGTPMLGKIEPGRQMECHERSLCNVCGEYVGRTLTFVGGPSEDRNLQNYTEAPLHGSCARWSLQVCPALLSAKERDGLIVSVIKAKEVIYLGDFINLDGHLFTTRFDVLPPGYPAVLLAVRAFTALGQLSSSEDWLKQ